MCCNLRGHITLKQHNSELAKTPLVLSCHITQQFFISVRTLWSSFDHLLCFSLVWLCSCEALEQIWSVCLSEAKVGVVWCYTATKSLWEKVGWMVRRTKSQTLTLKTAVHIPSHNNNKRWFLLTLTKIFPLTIEVENAHCAPPHIRWCCLAPENFKTDVEEAGR